MENISDKVEGQTVTINSGSERGVARVAEGQEWLDMPACLVMAPQRRERPFRTYLWCSGA